MAGNRNARGVYRGMGGGLERSPLGGLKPWRDDDPDWQALIGWSSALLEFLLGELKRAPEVPEPHFLRSGARALYRYLGTLGP